MLYRTYFIFQKISCKFVRLLIYTEEKIYLKYIEYNLLKYLIFYILNTNYLKIKDLYTNTRWHKNVIKTIVINLLLRWKHACLILHFHSKLLYKQNVSFFNLGIISLFLPIQFLTSSLKHTIFLLKYLKIIYNW